MTRLARLLVGGTLFLAASGLTAPWARATDSAKDSRPAATQALPKGGGNNSLFGGEPHVIVELDVPAGASVADLLQRLRQADPSFQYVARPGAWQDSKLPQIRLRDVDQQDVMMVLAQLVPAVQMRQISSTVWVLNGRSPAADVPRNELRAFGLTEPVERIGLKNAWAAVGKGQDAPTAEQIVVGRKQALKQVLSLLESAATQADSSFEPSLKLHEETEVLLVRGTDAQLNAVSQALVALQSGNGLQNYEQSYRHLADQYHQAINNFEKLAVEKDREIQALKKQLQEGGGKDAAGEKH